MTLGAKKRRAALWVAAGALAIASGACNAILGIDEFGAGDATGTDGGAERDGFAAGTREGGASSDDGGEERTADGAPAGPCTATSCPSPAICSNGACSCASNPTAPTFCSSGCANTSHDPENCGACGVACGGTCSSGRCVVTIAAAQAALAIAVNASRVYWVNADTTTDSGAFLRGSIRSAPLTGIPSGGEPAIVSSGFQLQGVPAGSLVIDGTNAYWLEGSTSDPDGGGPNDDGAILEAPLDGDGGVSTVLLSSLRAPSFLAADATSLYWLEAEDGSDADTVLKKMPKAGLTGGATPTILSRSNPGTSEWQASGNLVIANGRAYWGVYDFSPSGNGLDTGGAILATPVGGGSETEPDVVFFSAYVAGQTTSLPDALGVDGTSVYWAEQRIGAIEKTSIDAGGPGPAILASGQFYPFWLALDSSAVYWTTLSSLDDAGTTYSGPGAVLKGPLTGVPDGGAPIQIASGPYPSLLTLDATSVYWSSSGDILKATPK